MTILESLLLAALALLGVYCWRLRSAMKFIRQVRDYHAQVEALYELADWFDRMQKPVTRAHIEAYIADNYADPGAEYAD